MYRKRIKIVFFTYIYPYILNLLYVCMIWRVGYCKLDFEDIFFFLYILSSLLIFLMQHRFNACWSQRYLVWNPVIWSVVASFYPEGLEHPILITVTLVTFAVMLWSSIRFFRKRWRNRRII